MIWQCLAEAQLEMRALGRQIWENGVRKLCIGLHKPQKHSENFQTFLAAPLEGKKCSDISQRFHPGTLAISVK